MINPFGGTGRRPLTTAVVVCAAGAGLAFVAAGRAWENGPARAAESAHQTGADLVPGLSALALVGLAGAGALLATRGLGRRALGVLLVLVGLGVAGLALAHVAGADTVWPVPAAAGGLLVAVSGAAAVAVGQRWPAMGARYERASRGGPAGGTTDAWSALDRGEDPTLR